MGRNAPKYPLDSNVFKFAILVCIGLADARPHILSFNPERQVPTINAGASDFYSRRSDDMSSNIVLDPHRLNFYNPDTAVNIPEEGKFASSFFGFSVSASGNNLVLGYNSSALISINADSGPYFYMSKAFLEGSSQNIEDGSSQYPELAAGFMILTSASTQLVCVTQMNYTDRLIKCYTPNPNFQAGDASSAWRSVRNLYSPSWGACTNKESSSPRMSEAHAICAGMTISVWQSTLAFTAPINGTSRYFSTYYHENGTLVCSSGCDGTDTDAQSLPEPSFGEAIALGPGILVVGAPRAQDGRGSAFVFRAYGAADGSSYGERRLWRLSGELPSSEGPGPAEEHTMFFGAALSIGSTLLVIGAPGNGLVESAVFVYAYNSSLNVTGLGMTPVCTFKHINASFGESVAQSTSGIWTAIAIGSPGEERVYMAWVRQDTMSCYLQDTIRSTAAWLSPARFGSSVAISARYLFVGAPAHFRVEDNVSFSGLLFVAAYCFPGERLSSKSVMCPYAGDIYTCLLKSCSLCPLGTSYSGYLGWRQSNACQMCPAATFSPNTGASSCLACTNKPGNASYSISTGFSSNSCLWACNVGFYRVVTGQLCRLCVNAPAQAQYALGSADGGSSCNWICNAGYYKVQSDCAACPIGKFSLMPGASGLSSCQNCINKPGNSKYVFVGSASENCSWQCLIGFNQSGELCESCPAKPSNARWRINAASCTWQCNGGYSLQDSVSCVPCDQLFKIPSNASWDEDTCDWTCNVGYFNTSTTHPDCLLCSQFQEISNVTKPTNTFWGDGASTCSWVPNVGYNCSGRNSNATCAPCPDLPTQAAWIQWGDADFAPCAFRCKPDFYGHPTHYGVCVRCSQLTESFKSTFLKLPAAGGQWNDTAGRCDNSSWACSAGYKRSPTGARFCCPLVIPHSALSSSGPCNVVCDLSFGWNDTSAECTRCGGKPENAVWARKPPAEVQEDCYWQCFPGYRRSVSAGGGLAVCVDCDLKPTASTWLGLNESGFSPCAFRCNAGFYGHPDVPFVCIICSQFMEYFGGDPVLPANAMWDNYRGVCDSSTWTCKPGMVLKTFSSADGNGVVQYCCPQSIPNSDPDLSSEPCGVVCAAGFFWDPSTFTCAACTAPKDPFGFWGRDCAITIDCAAFAAARSLESPPHAFWRNRSASNDCTWECEAGYLLNRPAGLCCSVTTVGYGGAGGEWSRSGCEWICSLGLFRISPTATTCVPCVDYLRDGFGIDFCQRCGPTQQCCDGRVRTTAPANSSVGATSALGKCTVVVSITIVVMGITLDDFVMPSRTVPLLALLSSVIGTQVNLITATEQVQNSRRQGWRSLDSANSPRHDVNAHRIAPPNNHGGDSDDSAPTSERAGTDESAGSGGSSADAVGQQERAANGLRNVAVSAVCAVQDVDPAQAQELSQRIADMREALRAAVQETLGLNATVAQPLVAASTAAYQCNARYRLNPSTGACCPEPFRPPSPMRPGRVYWTAGGCQWDCVSPYLASGGSCQTCTEYNGASPAKFKPANSSWDDASPDCTGWSCNAGTLASSGAFACIPYSELKRVCARHDRCVTCSLDYDCVWCGRMRGCLPGKRAANNSGCPYDADGRGGVSCTCETFGCATDCDHTTCDTCIQDDYCGWCDALGACAPDSGLLSARAQCKSGWVSGTGSGGIVSNALVSSGASCRSGDGVWIIALVCTCVSAVLFGVVCVLVFLRSRFQNAVARLRAGAHGVASGPARRGPLPVAANAVAGIPSFRYAGRRGLCNPWTANATATEPPASSSSARVEEDDEPTCSVCLGGYTEGEILRMLGCCHVFHKACIDQWLSVSRECPLCKRDVTSPPPDPAAVEIAFAALQGRAQDSGGEVEMDQVAGSDRWALPASLDAGQQARSRSWWWHRRSRPPSQPAPPAPPAAAENSPSVAAAFEIGAAGWAWSPQPAEVDVGRAWVPPSSSAAAAAGPDGHDSSDEDGERREVRAAPAGGAAAASEEAGEDEGLGGMDLRGSPILRMLDSELQGSPSGVGRRSSRAHGAAVPGRGLEAAAVPLDGLNQPVTDRSRDDGI